MIRENQNDQQFDNSVHGQNEKDSRIRKYTSQQAQMQSDRTDYTESDILASDSDELENAGRYSKRKIMSREEYERSLFQGIHKNNDFSSMIQDDELDEDEDEDDPDGEYQDEDVVEVDEGSFHEIDDDPLDPGNSPDQNRDY
ncbi:MAG: hypothetical protein CVT94_12085 [Bacteroidetes bacterium HGW-Bacteroidetes-11]|jgi:hypothetical protein|nr:MAG: hypothetical protein CVT94_12085 [Bacteroidetes bacterium HGW-Bacteroidetes-11]